MAGAVAHGRIHSLESFGASDGPGVRLVVFLQGCPLRCAFCHNPDTWDFLGGCEMETSEIVARLEANRSFYANGGLTISGGEPLSQLPFLVEVFEQAHACGFHTCLDSSGASFELADKPLLKRLSRCLDLVLLDIKASGPQEYARVTGSERAWESMLQFATWLQAEKIPVRFRHVVVPGLTLDEAQLQRVARLASSFANAEGLELLPYHTLGVHKYEELRKPYALADTKELSQEDLAWAKGVMAKALQKKQLGNK